VLDGLHLVFVELPKFKAKNLTEKKMQVLWLRFLTEIDRDGADDVSQDLLDNPQTGEALEIVRESGMNDAERAAYEGFWDRVSIETTKKVSFERAIAERDAAVARADAAETELNAATAERDAATARADAAETELNAATAERDAATARADAAEAKLQQDKLQTARNLKALKLTNEQIAAATGLSAAEIENL
jgi:hypothetical protein